MLLIPYNEVNITATETLEHRLIKIPIIFSVILIFEILKPQQTDFITTLIFGNN